MAEQMIPVASENGQHRLKKERCVSLRFPTGEEHGCQLAAASTPEQPETGWFGKLRDLSVGGAALLLTRPFEQGSLLIMELSDPASGAPRAFFVRVVYAKMERKRHWLVGCEFVSALSEEELRALVGRESFTITRPNPRVGPS